MCVSRRLTGEFAFLTVSKNEKSRRPIQIRMSPFVENNNKLINANDL